MFLGPVCGDPGLERLVVVALARAHDFILVLRRIEALADLHDLLSQVALEAVPEIDLGFGLDRHGEPDRKETQYCGNRQRLAFHGGSFLRSADQPEKEVSALAVRLSNCLNPGWRRSGFPDLLRPFRADPPVAGFLQNLPHCGCGWVRSVECGLGTPGPDGCSACVCSLRVQPAQFRAIAHPWTCQISGR